ncbi:cysteine hydrolase family protein [Hydrocarboniclastica marina]|uniref:Cysteine hydrolase n=1 Tax=Hydrocarboniclastica marina TaxID=2259620 RepID=A0A4P7XLW8_9ALTE|nr:isochorismatase family cysteine hydrolase [Hydrocarboniclastica marina]MAM00109.1 cysteine hydrolase [Alteromonadaceae bacterium]QCF27422.1 cysteine hydrolase [Hydrocarboniclastica marina]|tara:strand:- start:794 stop:1504 length:711 start_codon:yes stop_codon:yes gene_type:complete
MNTSTDRFSVTADPYRWPYDSHVAPAKVALIIIDMQRDFCGEGGFLHAQGIDIGPARNTIEPISRVLNLARRVPGMWVIHTREGHRPELVDLSPPKLWRSQQVCDGIGSEGPLGKLLVRGEPGSEIIPELTPALGEPVIDKPGKGAFYATDFEHILRTCGITHLILAGLTTDVCVHSTLREACDRGFECLMLSDGTMATEQKHYEASLTMTTMQGGLFGCVASSAQLLEALEPLAE